MAILGANVDRVSSAAFVQISVLTNQECCLFDHFFDPLQNASASPLSRTIFSAYDFKKLRARLFVGNI